MLNWTSALVCTNFTSVMLKLHGSLKWGLSNLAFIFFIFLIIFINTQKYINHMRLMIGLIYYLLCLLVLACCDCPAIALIIAFCHWKKHTCGCGTRQWNNLVSFNMSLYLQKPMCVQSWNPVVHLSNGWQKLGDISSSLKILSQMSVIP